MRQQDNWNWQIDTAAERACGLWPAAFTVVLYLAGAALLLLQPRLTLDGTWAAAGFSLVLLAVIASIALCARVMLARGRFG